MAGEVPVMDARDKLVRIIGNIAGRKITDEDRAELRDEFPPEYEPIAAALEDLGEAIDRREREYTRHIIRLIRILIDAAESKDPHMRGNCLQITMLVEEFARYLDKSPNETETLCLAALAHKVGHINVPESILQQKGPLTPEQFEIIRQHPVSAESILKGLEFLADAASIIRHYHERYDGKGYPDGLAAEKIPEGSRILAVAVTYNALTSQRAYRSALDRKEACQILANVAGTQLDPLLVKKFIGMLDEHVDRADDGLRGASSMSGVNLA